MTTPNGNKIFHSTFHFNIHVRSWNTIKKYVGQRCSSESVCMGHAVVSNNNSLIDQEASYANHDNGEFLLFWQSMKCSKTQQLQAFSKSNKIKNVNQQRYIQEVPHGL